MLIAILTGITVLLGNIALLLYIKWRADRAIRAFFEAKEGELSAFGEITKAVWQQGASVVAGTLQRQAAGQNSADARGEKAVTKALIKDSNPLLGLALDKFPSLSKALTDNPNLLPIAARMLGKLGSQGNGGPPQTASKPETDIMNLYSYT